MTKKLELYKCSICGNLIEVVLEGEGELVCCGEIMEQLTSDNHSGSMEAHRPIIESFEDKKTVRIGQTQHPMTEEHHIEFIEVISPDEKYVKRKYLNPEEEAILEFECTCKNGFSAREVCNLHGLWEN
ncbi:desulfoferrodoxin FeS4 iron-binding domain-containing protein [bacterium]|nr:desulfoferrodoxin FeS4 iron-binding domain-containing protein [bacterium]